MGVGGVPEGGGRAQVAIIAIGALAYRPDPGNGRRRRGQARPHGRRHLAACNGPTTSDSAPPTAAAPRHRAVLGLLDGACSSAVDNGWRAPHRSDGDPAAVETERQGHAPIVAPVALKPPPKTQHRMRSRCHARLSHESVRRPQPQSRRAFRTAFKPPSSAIRSPAAFTMGHRGTRALLAQHKGPAVAPNSPAVARLDCRAGQHWSGDHSACKDCRTLRNCGNDPPISSDEASAKSAIGQQESCHSWP